MRTLGAAIAALLFVVTVAGCTTNNSIANVTTSPATLELAVGTLNDSAGTLGVGGTTLNVVTSFRNTLGNSAFQNPGQFSLAGPGGAVAPISACNQLFSYGLAPGCVTGAASIGAAPIGGVPPAYTPANTAGQYAMGFIPTGAPTTTGTYTVSTTVPVNGTSTQYSQTAALPASPTMLGADGGVTNFVSDGLGGGTFTLAAPPSGVTESLVVVVNIVAGAGTVVAEAETTGTTATITGANTTSCGGGGTGGPIPCGANSVFVIGADYPLVEAGPPTSHAVSPTLTGTGNTSDLTVSGVFAINE